MSFSIIHGSEMNRNSKQVRIVVNVVYFGKLRSLTIATIENGKIKPYCQKISLSLIVKFLGELYTQFIACKLSNDIMELLYNSVENVRLVKEIATTGRIPYNEIRSNN